MSYRACPDYVVLGHVAKDLLPGGGSMPGGTVTYAAITAQRLGLQAAIVTSMALADVALLDAARSEGVWIHCVPSRETTTFSNVYDTQGNRSQLLSAWADRLRYEDVPPEWLKAPIVHLGPIAQELPARLPAGLSPPLLGVTPQGWMRRWDSEGRVTQSASPVPEPLTHLLDNALLVLSIEDLGYEEELVGSYVNLAPIVVITGGAGDARVHSNGERTLVSAYPTQSVDPTGAGDVFAAALFTQYSKSGKLPQATRFAHATAACAIEGPGITAIPDRERVERREPGVRN
ncbi:MAG: ribokinase [Chloroflexi bacterium]|nr:ribokinase [Chloroflexota bacterium]